MKDTMNGPMSDVTLIHNPNSSGNRASDAEWLGAFPPAVRVIDCSALEEMSRSLRAAHAAGAEVVLIDGGDGTVREVLSRLPGIWGGALPQVGIFPRGNTNLIAREVGGLDGPQTLVELMRRRGAGEALPVTRRPILRVDYTGGEHPTLRGFMLGWGGYAAGTQIAREEVAAAGPRQVALTVFRTLRRALVGQGRAVLRRGVAARLTIDDTPAAEGARFIGLATTLEGRLVAGLNPFWEDGAGPEGRPIRWLDVLAPPRRLGLAAPFVLVGRPRRWMAAAGYASGRAAHIEVALDAPFVMDGDLFPAPRAGPLRLSAAEEVAFISP